MPALTKAQKARNQRAQEAAKAKRVPKTPVAQLGSDAWDEEEEEVNEGAMEPSSDAPHEGETNGKKLELAKFPDLLTTSRSAHENDAVVMGANQSHEEAYRSIRSAAHQLQGGTATAKQGEKKAGGLVRPSSTLAASRDTATRTKKKLAQRNGIRKSAYDELEDSPQRLAPQLRQPADATTFSPLRNQKKERRAEQQPPPSPRRSGRAQTQHGHHEPAATPYIADPHTQDPTGEDGDAMYRDWVSDAVAQQHMLAELEAEAGANEADTVEVAMHEGEEAQEEAPPPPSAVIAKRGRGRPPKADKKLEAKSVASQGPRMQQLTAQVSPQKQGTPKSTPISQPRSSARAQRRLNEMAQQRGSAEGQRSQTQPTDEPATVQGTTTQTSPRRSRRIEQSIADLNQRRNTAATVDSALDAAAAVDGAEPPADEDEDGEVLPDKPVILRRSEMQFPIDNDGPEESEGSEAETAEASTGRKGKRQAISQAAQANTGKRRKKTQPEDEDYDESDDQQGIEERHRASQRRLWGQWLALKQIHGNVQYVGCNFENGELCQQNEIDLDDNDVKAVIKLCTEAKRRYQHLAEGTADVNLDPASVLEDIGRRVDGLRGRDPDYPTNFEDKTKVTNIYFHLIPALVKLVMRAVTCYEALDKNEVSAGQISMNHLQIVLGLVRLTLDMEYAAQKFYKARPDTSDAVVRPVHNDITVPLGTVRATFQKILQRHYADIKSAERRQQEAQDRALRLEQEEWRSRQAAEVNRIRQKWEQLHRERMAAEGGLMRPAKFAHLRMPDPNLDEDFDGNTFNRISVFHPRVGPPPGLIAKAKALVWTEGELRALEDGLRRYAGRMVYERVFREWCPSGRMLNRYSVTEIVAAAEIVKEFYEGQDGEGAEAWVKAIPVWSKAHAVGKENEDESFVDVDEAAGTAATAGPS